MEQMELEEFATILDEVEAFTVSGRLIGATRNTEAEAVDDSYPLRFHLRQLSRYIWADLMKWQRQPEDIMHAVDVVRDEFKSYFGATEVVAADEEESNLPCSESCSSGDADFDTGQEIGIMHAVGVVDDEFKRYFGATEVVEADEEESNLPCSEPCSSGDDDFDTRQEVEELPIEDETSPFSAPLLDWYLQTDPSVGLESVAGEWLERKELWRVEVAWTWADIHDLLALLTIDSAVLHIEQDEPFKAAVATARASERHGMATAIRWSGSVQEATASTFGRRGADARHGPNRAAREEAIRLYLSRSWPSLAQAARSIAAQVHRTERVVEKWLREHRRALSAGTVPT